MRERIVLDKRKSEEDKQKRDAEENIIVSIMKDNCMNQHTNKLNNEESFMIAE